MAKKRILAYEINTYYDSYRQAARDLGLFHNNIIDIINNYNKSLKGIHFFHEDFVVDPTKLTYYVQEHRVFCWELQQWFDSHKKAAKATGAAENNITKCLNKPNKTTGGYHWCGKEDFFKGVPLTGGRGSNIVNIEPVFNYTHKKWFKTQTEAAEAYGLANSISISEIVNNPYRRAAGCHWCDTETYFDGMPLSALSPNNTEGSAPEIEIKEFIRNLGFECDKSRKTLKSGKELDILVKDKNLAIEYNGSRWHSEEFNSDQKYHQSKSLEAINLGIELIHIYEFEFKDPKKKQKILNHISHKLGISLFSIYARQCDIREVTDPKLVRKFLDENHIQGFSPSSVKVGLFHNEELVSLMTFTKPKKRGSKYEWELTRFCTKSGYNIPGAASKLLKYFERTYKPNNLVTYANLDYSSGKLYDNLNFTKENLSCNSYVYTKGKSVVPKRSAERKNLVKLLGDKFNPDLSEKENMVNNGYYKINLAGTITFVKNYS